MGRKVGLILLGIVAAFVALAALLPLLLLPFATAVPLPISLVLILAELGLLPAMVTWAHTLATKTAVMAALLVLSLLAVWLSQWFSTTPPIRGTDGQPLPGSLAELEAVELNGRRQWITLRGHDAKKPVLLFLAGGPGGSQLAATRKQLAGLEKHFIVVNWDQPGVAKSYQAADFDELKPEQYIADADALTRYLQARFAQEKIYLFGESWVSLLGIWLVQRYPENYHAPEVRFTVWANQYI